MRRLDFAAISRIVVTVALGGIGASAGFTHTHDWAVHHGQYGWLAWADAVVIEGMAVVAGFEVHRDHQSGRRGLTLPQTILAVAFLIQMTAQVAQAERSPAGWLLAAMPALGFLTVVKLTMRRLPTDDQSRTATPPTTPSTVVEIPDATSLPVRPQGTVNRLPVNVRSAVIATAEQVHSEGRKITAADIARTITLPEPMLTNVVAELNTTVNNHRVQSNQD